MNSKLSLVPKFFCIALLLVLPAVSRADIVNENFDSLPTSLNATNLGAFSVTSGSVDLVGGALYGYLCAAPESGNCVDLDGSTNTAGVLSTGDLVLNPGTYVLSFDLIGSQRGNPTSTTVTLGSFYNQTFNLSSGDITSGIVSTVFTVGSTTAAPLIFTSNTPGYNGALLDNVDLKLTSPVSTPEPPTLLLLGIGLVSLAIFGRLVAAR
jgi:hypothetical protein